jgi:hypothetical protein
MCDKKSIRELLKESKNGSGMSYTSLYLSAKVEEELEKRICPHCGKPIAKHIIQEGARFHITSWHGSPNGALSHCSEKDCENNHGEGHCVPYSEETKRRMREYDMKRRVKETHTDSGTRFIEENFR